MPYLRSSRCRRSSESWKIRPVETMAIRKGQRAMSSGPRVLMMWPFGSSHTFFVEDHTALGMPSLSGSSTCHCSVSVDGQRISTGAIVEQDRDHGARRERQRLADADFVGEQQPRLSVGLAVLQEHRHERTLPRLKLFAASVDRAFGQRGGRAVPRACASSKRISTRSATRLISSTIASGSG